MAAAAYVALGTRGWLGFEELPAALTGISNALTGSPNALTGRIDYDSGILARGLLVEVCGLFLATLALGHAGRQAATARSTLALEAAVLLGALFLALWGLAVDPGSRLSSLGLLRAITIGSWPMDPWISLRDLLLLAGFAFVPLPSRGLRSIRPVLIALTAALLFAPLLGVALVSSRWQRSGLLVPALVLGLGALWLALDSRGAPGPGVLTLALVPLGLFGAARRGVPQT